MKNFIKHIFLICASIFIQSAYAEVHITRAVNYGDASSKIVSRVGYKDNSYVLCNGSTNFVIPINDSVETYIDIRTKLYKIRAMTYQKQIFIIGQEIVRENGTFRPLPEYTLLKTSYNNLPYINLELIISYHGITLRDITNERPNKKSSSKKIVSGKKNANPDQLSGKDFFSKYFIKFINNNSKNVSNEINISQNAQQQTSEELQPVCMMCNNIILSNENYDTHDGVTFHDECALDQARSERDLFQAYEKSNKGKEPDEILESMSLSSSSSSSSTFSSSSTSSSSFSSSFSKEKEPEILKNCTICFDEKELVKLSCGHEYCSQCLERLLDVVLKEKNSTIFVCPDPSCKTKSGERTKLTARDAHSITNNKEKIERFCSILTIESLDNLENIWRCPTADCPNIMIREDLMLTRVQCSHCKQESCAKCSGIHSDRITCKDAKLAGDSNAANKASEDWIKQNTKQCPKCQTNIQKNEGCKHMTCKASGCQHEFCWDCLQPWTHTTHPDFYSCPSLLGSLSSSTVQPVAQNNYMQNIYYDVYHDPMIGIAIQHLITRDFNGIRYNTLLLAIRDIMSQDAYIRAVNDTTPHQEFNAYITRRAQEICINLLNTRHF